MKNRFLIVMLLCVLSPALFAQYDITKIDKKAIEAYNKGIEKAQDGKYKDAIESLEEAVKRDSRYVDAYLSLAGVYGQQKNTNKALPGMKEHSLLTVFTPLIINFPIPSTWLVSVDLMKH